MSPGQWLTLARTGGALRMNILITGAAGFIGAHTALRLLKDGHQVTGLDNFNDYYDPQLKRDRVRWVEQQVGQFPLYRLDLGDTEALDRLFAQVRPQVVINLAAQAGGRYSLENPKAYLHNNLGGFLNLLEMCRRYPPEHLIYASSSSVYGTNHQLPHKTSDTADHPLSLYAASKRANELMAHSYSHLFDMPATGLRFFTVYGPWGRPDMSPVLFARAICEGRPLKLFNYGMHQRDFTYIDDLVESLVRLLGKPPVRNPLWNREQPDPATSMAPWRLFNIGGQRSVELKDYVATLEQLLGRKAQVEYLPLQPGTVLNSCADASALENVTGFGPQVPLAEGLGRFVDWFQSYYRPPLPPRS